MKKYIILSPIFLALAFASGYFALWFLNSYLLALSPPPGYLDSFLTISEYLTLTIIMGSLLIIFLGLFIFSIVKLIIKICKKYKPKSQR